MSDRQPQFHNINLQTESLLEQDSFKTNTLYSHILNTRHIDCTSQDINIPELHYPIIPRPATPATTLLKTTVIPGNG